MLDNLVLKQLFYYFSLEFIIEDEWMANLVINKSILKMILKSVLYFPIFFSSHFIGRAYNLHFTEFTVTDFKTHDYFTYH